MMSHRHIPIYPADRIPGNSEKSKLEDLTPWHPDWSASEACETLFRPEKRLTDMSGANTVTRLLQIPSGHVKRTYTDVPYLVPFITPDSRACVLICPGGAYYDVSLDHEGYPTAAYLQAHGVTAFVLKYRVWPYRHPAAQLDCRRALAFLHFHAKDLGIDPERISLLGYSAGGNLAASTVFCCEEFPLPETYIPDEIDREETHVASLALLYPEVLADRFLLSMQYGDRMFRDTAFADRIIAQRYVPQYVTSDAPPVFLCDCVDDTVVSPENILAMASAYQRAGASYEVHMFREGGHGYGVTQEDVPPMYGNPGFDMRGTREWVNLYLTWLAKTVGAAVQV